MTHLFGAILTSLGSFDQVKGEDVKGMDKANGSASKLDVTSSAIGGALVAGAAGGLTLGPVGTVAGLVMGGVAGEIFDRYVDTKHRDNNRDEDWKGTTRTPITR